MDFYEVVQKRSTCREFTAEPVEKDALRRILEAAVKAPTNNHLRQWRFVILHTDEEKKSVLQSAAAFAAAHQQMAVWPGAVDSARAMYAYAIPRQYEMLRTAPYVVLPFFASAPALFSPVSMQSFNTLSAAWCMVENIFLAAAAEGLACSVRIPAADEERDVARCVRAEDGWRMPCYIGIGHPAKKELPFTQPVCDLSEVVCGGSFDAPFSWK